MATSFTYNYDIALRTLAYTRFGSILGINTLGSSDSESINKGVVLCPKAIAQRWVAEKRGETFLEFINIHPSKYAFSWARNRTSVGRKGLRYTKSDTTMGVVTADPIDLTYNMWFWSQDLDKVRLCMEKYIQWQHDSPKIDLVFETDFEMNPDLRFSPVIDESAIEDIFNTGKIWVYRMPVSIEGWIPKLGTNIGKVYKIRLTTYDKDEIEDYTEVAVEDGNQNTELAAALRMFRANLYAIESVDASAKTFVVVKDRTSDFTASRTFTVENSTYNNELYTVVSSSYSVANDETTITVLEDPVSDIADGNIYLHTGTD